MVQKITSEKIISFINQINIEDSLQRFYIEKEKKRVYKRSHCLKQPNFIIYYKTNRRKQIKK